MRSRGLSLFADVRIDRLRGERDGRYLAGEEVVLEVQHANDTLALVLGLGLP